MIAALGVGPVDNFSDEDNGSDCRRYGRYYIPSILGFLRDSRFLRLDFCVLRHRMTYRTSKARCSANEIRGLYKVGMATTTVRAFDVLVNRKKHKLRFLPSVAQYPPLA